MRKFPLPRGDGEVEKVLSPRREMVRARKFSLPSGRGLGRESSLSQRGEGQSEKILFPREEKVRAIKFPLPLGRGLG